jgi:hypothetical protein
VSSRSISLTDALPGWDRRHLLAVLAAAGTAWASSACAAPGGTAAPIDRPTALIMIRSALLALDQANKTGNYTVLRDLGGPAFRVNTAARLSEVFADLRRQSVDLSVILAEEPVFTSPPMIDASGRLRVAGSAPLGQRRLDFQIAWQPEEGQWRLYGVVVTASQSAPPSTPQPNRKP